MIAYLKSKAFKLPLPGYTNRARAMERCHNGLHMKWHPITAFVGTEVAWAVMATSWSFQTHERHRINQREGSELCRIAVNTGFKESYQGYYVKIRDLHVHDRDGISLSAVCYRRGLSLNSCS